MIVRQVAWFAFGIPFVEPFATARDTLRRREGMLIRLTCDDGTIGWGEASPLPALNGDTVDQARQALYSFGSCALGLAADRLGGWLDELTEHDPRSARLLGGLEMAALDAIGRREGRRLAEMIASRVRDVVAVNATVAIGAAEEAAAAAARAVEAGYGCVKLKVGVCGNVVAEVARVRQVRDAMGPQPRLRLDANGAWDPPTAIATIRALAACDLELVEQPTPADDLTGLARVRRGVDVPIGADEAVTGLAAARAILQADAADVLIVKPTVLGGPRRTRQIVELADAAGVGAIVTTTLEAGVGTAAALHLAATLGESAPACGLATAELLEHDLLRDRPTIRAGTMTLPTGPGLGVTVDAAALARYRTDQDGEVGTAC